MLILSGYSETRSTYCKKSNFLRLFGWVLSPKVDCIVIYNNDLEVAKTTTFLENMSVYNSYKFGNIKSSWEIKNYVKDLDINCLEARFYQDNKLQFSTKLNINVNDTKEKYLDTLDITNEIYSRNKKDIVKEIEKLDIKLTNYYFDELEYLNWYQEVDYIKNYSNYCNEFKLGDGLHIKALQHYISIKLLELMPTDIYLDVASSNSACPDIIKNFYTHNVYRQDLNYDKGVNNDMIGSNANNIPLKNESIDKITMHCSFEHFENNSDIEFLYEAYRLLKPNGKVVITPLYMSTKEYIETSPSIWETKYLNQKDFPVFSKNYPLVLNEVAEQRQSKYFSPKSLKNEILIPFSNKFIFEIIYIDNGDNFDKLVPSFSLVAIKK